MYGYRKILRITWPLMFGTFIQSIVTFSDAVFVSELGDTAIGAFGNSSLLYLSLFMFSRGLADGTQIEVAYLDGKSNFKGIGKTLLNAQAYQFLLSTLLFLVLFIAGEFIVYSLSNSTDIAASMHDFIKVRAWGLFFAAQQMTLVGFFIGLGRTPVILYSALLIALSNIFFDYCFIRGELGFPALGLEGAALASSIAEALGFFFLLGALISSTYLKKMEYSIFKKLTLVKFIHLFKLSFPLMLQGLFSLTTWLVFFTLIEGMGKPALETAHNIRYMYFLAFVPIFGFAASTKTIVSNLKGQEQFNAIQPAIVKLIVLSIAFMFIFFHGALLYPELLIKMVDHNPTISAQVLNDSVYIIQFVAGSILIYSVTAVLFNSVSGLGKTTITFGIEVIAIVLYLIACYYFIYEWNWDIKAVWWVEYIYFITLGVFSFAYLVYYRKKLMQ